MGTPRPTLNILVVDDHQILREGVQRILAAADPHWRVATCGSGHEALQAVRKEPFDVVIADLTMPGMSGLDLIKRLRAEQPAPAVLVLSMHGEEQFALRAFRAGARGYVTKDSAGRELVDAVRRIAAGGAFVTASLAERVVLQMNGVTDTAAHERLTDRELDVLRRLAAGERPTDIGTALHLSIKTVSSHKARILAKLELPNLAALVRYALAHGLVDAADATVADADDTAALARPVLPAAPSP